MEYKKIMFSGHAVRQMFQRVINHGDVLAVIRTGEVIIGYPDDKPYPSQLKLGFIDNKPLHVVLAVDRENQTGIVVTTYYPDSQLWTEDFKSRKKL